MSSSQSLATENTQKLQDFFTSYHDFSYKPQNGPEAEFERLCRLRNWGPKALAKHQTKFNTILAAEKLQEKSAWNTGLINDFFKKYEFECFKYDQSGAVMAEFERLCHIKQWDTAKRNNARIELYKAVHLNQPSISPGTKPQDDPSGKKRPNPSAEELSDFFQKYEFCNFKYSPKADPVTEFDRLCNARQWARSSQPQCGKTQLSSQSNHQAKGALSPLAAFFTSYNCSRGRYMYAGLAAPVEFKLLTERVTKPDWEAGNIDRRHHEDRNRDKQNGKAYWRSTYHEDLKAQYYRAVEREFDWLIGNRARKAGLQDHEYVIELLELGKAPIPLKDAKAILAKVNVNIYDFIEYEAALNKASVYDPSNPEKASLPAKPPLYPSNSVLGVYCWVTGRIYDLKQASSSGTLVLLLKHVGDHFCEESLKIVLHSAKNDMHKPDSRAKSATMKVVNAIHKWLRSDEGELVLYRQRQRDLHPYTTRRAAPPPKDSLAKEYLGHFKQLLEYAARTTTF
ncbi:hypothetical protein BDZ91DRAFT_736745 [Kalaharituber pfeilii]|nr:hypothetical protein BDZ91DRAFT_736745 [Kalaharituber pfeilii]